MLPHTRTGNPGDNGADPPNAGNVPALVRHGMPGLADPAPTAIITPAAANPLAGVDLQALLAQLLLERDSIKCVTISLSDIDKVSETLDRGKNNWPKWSLEMQDIIFLNHGGEYLTGAIPRPDDAIDPTGASVWDTNNRCIVAALRRKCSPEEQTFLRAYTNAQTAWDALRTRHEKIGSNTQILLIQKLLAIRYRRSEQLSTTSHLIAEGVSRIYSMGAPTEDVFYLVVLLNALSKEFPEIRDRITDDISRSPDADLHTSVRAWIRLPTEQRWDIYRRSASYAGSHGQGS